MPYQNRVTPLNELVAASARGTLMGNRGCLHDAHKQICRSYQGTRWIICTLSFKDRRRAIMTPGLYTELFFLDEATALAAGHRPCMECQRERFKAFQAAWAAGNPDLAGGPAPATGTIDRVLHAERLTRDRNKATYRDHLANLPTGTFVMREAQSSPYLVLEHELRAWSLDGYGPPLARPSTEIVHVLTPRSIVRAVEHGFVTGIHSSALDGTQSSRPSSQNSACLRTHC